MVSGNLLYINEWMTICYIQANLVKKLQIISNKNQMAQLFIQIDKPYYFAGDTVQGCVFLNLYENANAHQLKIKFKGWESVRWIQEQFVSQEEAQRINADLIWGHGIHVHMDSSDSEDSAEEDQFVKFNYVRKHGQIKRLKRYSGGRQISKFVTTLYDFGGNYIPSGQYSFPITFKTGQHYPASFSDKALDRTRKGRIKYEIQAYIRGGSRKRLLKYRTEVIMRETMPIKNEQKQMVAHVKSCCCIDQGTSKILCYFEKNGYSPGEDANMHCIVDAKESKANVTNVTVQLINKITYVSKENHQHEFSNVLLSHSFPGIPKGESVERSQTVKILNNQNVDKTDIKPTCRGSKLSSVYFLKVQANLAASCTCCSELPVVYQPILIYPYIPVNYAFSAPPNWNPQTMPMLNLMVPINNQNPQLNSMNNPYY